MSQNEQQQKDNTEKFQREKTKLNKDLDEIDTILKIRKAELDQLETSRKKKEQELTQKKKDNDTLQIGLVEDQRKLESEKSQLESDIAQIESTLEDLLNKNSKVNERFKKVVNILKFYVLDRGARTGLANS